MNENSTKIEPQCNVRRKVLSAAISTFLMEQGVDLADKDVLETMTEMLQCFICETGLLARNYCELSGRSEPLISDAILAFVEMGYDFGDLESYIKLKHQILPALQPQHQHKQYSMLSAGTKQPLPPHILQHLPQFPDPHAYIRTPTHKQPIIDYESVREKAAIQKKDIERALTKFLAKTSSQTHNLFDSDDPSIFPLIASKPSYPPYLSALMPQDQIFDAEDLEYDPKMQMQQQAKAQKAKESKEDAGPDETEEQRESAKNEENSSSNTYIDNPYLAATKLPHNETMDIS